LLCKVFVNNGLSLFDKPTFLTVLPDSKTVNALITPLSKLYMFPTMGGVTNSSTHTEQLSVPLRQAMQSSSALDNSLFSIKKDEVKPTDAKVTPGQFTWIDNGAL
jgi:hypothetical protein